MFILIKNFR